MAPNGIPHLQLPALAPLEPLTSGTNLPHVPAEELTPTENTSKDPKPPPTPTSLDASSTTPPQSPGRPTSMRRFLSRVSLNSSYTHEDDDKGSILSGPLSPTTSVMSRDSKRKVSGGKKGSWWKKSKKEDKNQNQNQNLPKLPPAAAAAAATAATAVAAQVAAPSKTESSPTSSPPQGIARAKTVQYIAPPPRLPDDLFGSGFSSLDSDMFKNFK